MRSFELDCFHGIGHSSALHTCDGCCHLWLIEPAVEAEQERIVNLLEEHLGNMDWEDILILIKEYTHG